MTMTKLQACLTPGIEVLDANATHLGQVEEVQDEIVLIRLQLQIAVPVDVIHEISRDRVLLDSWEADWLPVVPGVEEVRPQGGTGTICCACGASAGTEKAVPYLRKKDAWFCAECWCTLRPAALARLVQEVDLRGVPLN
jgi:hypothetical protein